MNWKTLIFQAITIACYWQSTTCGNYLDTTEDVSPLSELNLKYQLNLTINLDDVLQLRRTPVMSSVRNLQWTVYRGTPQTGDQRPTDEDTSLYLAFHLDSLPESIHHFYGDVSCQLRTKDGRYYQVNHPREIGLVEGFSYRVQPLSFPEGTGDRLTLTCAVRGFLRSKYSTDLIVKKVKANRPVPLSRGEVSFILSKAVQIQFEVNCYVNADPKFCWSQYRPEMGVEIQPRFTDFYGPEFLLYVSFSQHRGRVLYANCALNNERGDMVARESVLWTSQDSENYDFKRISFPKLLQRDERSENINNNNDQSATIDLHCYVELLVNFENAL